MPSDMSVTSEAYLVVNTYSLGSIGLLLPFPRRPGLSISRAKTEYTRFPENGSNRNLKVLDSTR